jgi:hypothetical protein
MLDHILLPQIKPTRPGDEYRLDIKPEQIQDARLFRSRADLVLHCSRLTTMQTIAEIGVYKGDFSQQLLNLLNPACCYLIDIDLDKLHPELRIDKRVRLLRGRSWEVLEEVSDSTLDYVYVDGDHSYEGVKNDLLITHRKTKPGGIIQFNDYCTYSRDKNVPYGILDVVNSYLENNGGTIVGLSLDRSGYHDIAIQRP